MSSKDKVVIIGSGLAGYTLARELRKLAPDVPIHVLTRDRGQAYSKPMLSNALAKGKTAETLAMKTAAETAIELSAQIDVGVSVTRIDRERKVVVTDGGDVPYAQLVLALGADPINLPFEGDGAAGVIQVNDLEDYGRFRESLGASARRVMIIGAGLIGCEFANDLAPQGHTVHVIDLAEWPMARFVPEAMGKAIQGALSAAGVSWHLGTRVGRIDRHGGGFRTTLASGGVIESDIVISAVGLRSRTQLAQAAGLAVNRGIVVDATLRSSDPGIFALGDCAEVEGRVLPFVMPLMTAARVLAKTLSGTPTPVVYPPMPVVVKTPACPTVVLPPEPGEQGKWQVVGEGIDLTARFVGPEGRLLGFSLTGAATASRAAILKEMA